MAYKLRVNPRELLAQEDKVLKDGKVLRYDLEPEKEQATATQPQAKATAQSSSKDETVPVPKLYNDDGSLNKTYDSNIFQDMMAGVNLGGRVGGANGNSLQQVAGQIGGLIGGIFAKNIAGRQRFERDLQTAEAINQVANAKTNAQIRLEAEARQRQLIELKRQKEIRDDKYKEALLQAKTDKDRVPILRSMFETAETLESKEEVRKTLANIWKVDPEHVTDDSIIEWGTPVVNGSFRYMQSKSGKTTRAILDENDNPISTLSLPDFLRMTQNIGKGKITIEDRQESLLQATNIVNNYISENKDSYKNNKGGVDNLRKTANIMKTADQILKNKAESNTSTLLEIDGQMVDLTKYLSLPKPTSSSDKKPVEKEGSVFIGTTPPIIDGTNGGIIEVPVGGKPMAVTEKQADQPIYTFNIGGKDVDVEFSEEDKADKGKSFHYIRDYSGINVNEGKWKKLGQDIWVTKRNGIVYTVVKK